MTNGEIVVDKNGTTYTWNEGIWSPYAPVIGIGDGFFIRKTTDWKQNLHFLDR